MDANCMTNRPDFYQLRALSPFNGMKADSVQSLLDQAEVHKAKPGEFIFREGDETAVTVYVLSGEVGLNEGGRVTKFIRGGTDTARFPVSPDLPRHCGAVATDLVEFITIESMLLDVSLTWDQTGVYEVGEFKSALKAAEDDWMVMLLYSKAFQRIPPATLQSVFSRLQQVPYKAGDTIICQGDEADYSYIVRRGTCAVSRQSALGDDPIALAELTVGATFGEEALILDGKRNATVTMETDGAVMRLDRANFQTLLKGPMLESVDSGEAETIVEKGGRWLDVRLPSEFAVSHKDGAVNLPLYMLRLKLNVLDPEMRYVVCCNTGQRSSAAAFVLCEKGFRAVVLKGGLTSNQ